MLSTTCWLIGCWLSGWPNDQWVIKKFRGSVLGSLKSFAICSLTNFGLSNTPRSRLRTTVAANITLTPVLRGQIEVCRKVHKSAPEAVLLFCFLLTVIFILYLIYMSYIFQVLRDKEFETWNWLFKNKLGEKSWFWGLQTTPGFQPVWPHAIQAGVIALSRLYGWTTCDTTIRSLEAQKMTKSKQKGGEPSTLYKLGAQDTSTRIFRILDWTPSQ